MRFLPEWNLAGIKKLCNLTGKSMMINLERKLSSKKMLVTVENQ